MTTRHPDQPRLRDWVTVTVLLTALTFGVPLLVDAATGWIR
ncbi:MULTISPECIES: hypothetical protein [unclassified Microbacterium]